ncbi:MAG TPA: glycerophosphodiester phosphodiesterase family protein [Actinomycetes bacterium]|nr:glycerophosphodiester phosphodiesterase family protein [Actinomycetes bacterium]
MALVPRPDRPTNRPLVIAHRGASIDAPEHTLAAYQRAIDDGADGLEADVRLTADGHLVCVHDRRVDRTSNGRGVLSTLELADLESLDFGSWKSAAQDAEEPDQLGAGAHGVLTLARLLQLVVDAPRPIDLAIETKHPTRYAGLVERRLIETLAQAGLAAQAGPGSGQVRVMSFSEVALRRVRRLAPGLPMVLLMERVPVSYRLGSLPRGVAVAGPSIEILRAHPKFVQRLISQGHQVHVWTVDDPNDVELVARLGVDAIITNRPKQVMEQLQQASSTDHSQSDADTQ